MSRYYFFNGFKVKIHNSNLTIQVNKAIAENFLSRCAIEHAEKDGENLFFDSEAAALVAFEIKKIQKMFEQLYHVDLKRYIIGKFPAYSQIMGMG